MRILINGKYVKSEDGAVMLDVPELKRCFLNNLTQLTIIEDHDEHDGPIPTDVKVYGHTSVERKLNESEVKDLEEALEEFDRIRLARALAKLVRF